MANDDDTNSKYEHSNDASDNSDTPPEMPKDKIIHDAYIDDL